MRVSCSPEQKARAIEVHNEAGSYAKTIRILGYPSRHVLLDWVRSPGPKPSPKRPDGPARRYGWELKRHAVEMVAGGQDIKYAADRLGVVNHATIYEWARKWRARGDVGPMSRRGRVEAGTHKTRAQLEAALPDDVGELRRLAAKLMAERAVFEQELGLAKNTRAASRENCRTRTGLK